MLNGLCCYCLYDKAFLSQVAISGSGAAWITYALWSFRINLVGMVYFQLLFLYPFRSQMKKTADNKMFRAVAVHSRLTDLRSKNSVPIQPILRILLLPWNWGNGAKVQREINGNDSWQQRFPYSRPVCPYFPTSMCNRRSFDYGLRAQRRM